jgi:tetratricopeptide (TPR) repeat protein
MSLGFNGLVADWYWMRTLQYVGRKIESYQGELQLDDLSPVGLRLLAPMLDVATTLDPDFLAAYQYAAVVLPAVDVDAAVKLTEKGIAANPHAWPLYQHLGYIHWQRRDYQKASEVYRRGAQIPGAPRWMELMARRMEAEGGSRDTARAIYTQLYEQADDESIKLLARNRLLQLRSLDERDLIRRVLAQYQARTGRCAGSWGEVAPVLRAVRLNVDASGTPVDPSGAPYQLVQGGCDVDLGPHSSVPRK